MQDAFYILKNGEQLGPFDVSEVRAQLQNGSVSKDDLFWSSGMPEWKPLHAFPISEKSEPSPLRQKIKAAAE